LFFVLFLRILIIKSFEKGRRDDCRWDKNYDPRNRPWFIAATSGPKDIVFIIDASISMSYNNMLFFK